MKRHFVLAGIAAIGMALTATVAMAQAADSTLAQARANGLIGEQADGYLGFVPGATISADLRGRVDQNNIQRRQLYTQRASQRGATVNEMAAPSRAKSSSDRVSPLANAIVTKPASGASAPPAPQSKSRVSAPNNDLGNKIRPPPFMSGGGLFCTILPSPSGSA